jgi:putative peptide zinc metalloprotease protein
MPVDRPTFSESWYRVAELRPRLRPRVQVHRQHFRGTMWHVVQDPASNQFFRLSDAAYHFVSLLDGERTVAEAWEACNEHLGDAAPTQGEVIQLLGQLYTSNLLRGELPPDAQSLLGRYRKRIRRQVQGYLTNLLFMRFPLLDPNRFLDRWVSVFGKIFTWYGLVVWLIIMAAGFYAIAGKWGELVAGSRDILDPSSLPMLYLAFVIVKIFHEFGHGFACKRMGQIEGAGGEVHTMGIMLLVLTPMPYVDASSAWAFRKKWQRVVVGASGMYVELAVAAVAAMVWASAEGSPMVRALTYRIMLVASVSSLLFNGNPLLRYDAYYILSDILEIPNLHQRSKQYVYYLVKRYVWGIRKATSPAHNRGERGWFFFYGIASTIYRVLICTVILWRIASNEKLFIFAAVLAASAVVGWVIIPLGRFVHYLLAGHEVARVRGRAILSTVAALALVVVGVGIVPAPDRYRIPAVVEPDRMQYVHAGQSGFVERYLPSGRRVSEGDVLVKLSNPALHTELKAERANLERLRLEQQEVEKQRGVAAAQMYDKAIAAKQHRIEWLEGQVAALTVTAPLDGEWVAPDIQDANGAFIERGRQVGFVAAVGNVRLHGVASQAVPVGEIDQSVEIRPEGRPQAQLAGRITDRDPAGATQLPSPSLGYLAGGSVQTASDDKEGLRAVEPFFRVMVKPVGSGTELLPNQRVVIRASAPPKPLAVQAYRKILQLVNKKFRSS